MILKAENVYLFSSRGIYRFQRDGRQYFFRVLIFAKKENVYTMAAAAGSCRIEKL
jgi:hypothetical protein